MEAMPTTFPLSALALVALGGGFGAAARYLFGLWATNSFGPGFPWGTWGVNIIGGLAMGALVTVAARHEMGHELRLLLGVGFLGGFTTFSAYGLQTFALLRDGQPALAATNVLASNLAGLLMVWAGYSLAKLF